MRRYRRVVRPACAAPQHDQTLVGHAETCKHVVRRHAVYTDGGNPPLGQQIGGSGSRECEIR